MDLNDGTRGSLDNRILDALGKDKGKGNYANTVSGGTDNLFDPASDDRPSGGARVVINRKKLREEREQREQRERMQHTESRRNLAATITQQPRQFGDQSPQMSAIDKDNSEVMRDQPSLTDMQSFAQTDGGMTNMPMLGFSKIQGSHRVTLDHMPNSGRVKPLQSVQILHAPKLSARQSVVQSTLDGEMESVMNKASSNQQLLKYQKDLLKIMTKFAQNHTVTKGTEELREFMATEVTENDRMLTLLNSFTEFNAHTRLQQQKEQIKLFSLASEVFEESLVPYIPRILSTLCKLVKEDATTKLHQTVADTMGLLAMNTVEKLEGRHLQTELFQNQYLKFVFNMLDKQSSKVIQAGAILCLTQIVLNCPIEVLYECLDYITDRIMNIMKQKSFQCRQQMLEGLISMIFYIKEDFAPYCNKFVPNLIEYMKITDPKQVNTKRVAIDLTYSIGAHCSDEIMDHVPTILKILDDCRTDKNQPVRAASQETIKLLKEIHKINDNESNRVTSGPPMILDMKKLVNNRDENMRSGRKTVQQVTSERQRKNAVAKVDDVQVLDVDVTSDLSEILDHDNIRPQQNLDQPSPVDYRLGPSASKKGLHINIQQVSELNDSQSSQRGGGAVSQRAETAILNHKNQKKSVVKLDQKLRDKERQSYNSVQASGQQPSPLEEKKARALKKKQMEEQEEIKKIQEQAKEKYGLVESKLDQIENISKQDQSMDQYEVRGQRNLKQFMQSKRRNMHTASSQALGNKSESPEKYSDSESANKFKNLFKKEKDEASDKEGNSSNPEREMFDLTALHKRNERQRQIQASRSGIYSDINDQNFSQTQAVKPGRYSNLRQRGDTSKSNDRKNTDTGDLNSKRKQMGMKMNPNFMKSSRNTDVIVSPNNQVDLRQRNSVQQSSHQAKIRTQEEVSPVNEAYHKKHSVKADISQKKRTSSTKISNKNSPKMAYAISTIKFTRQADAVTTKPKTRSKSGTLLDFVRSQQRGGYNEEEQELMETGIIIKTPDDKKKTAPLTEQQKMEEPANNNIDIMIYEGPQKDNKLRKNWGAKQVAVSSPSNNDQVLPTPASNAQTGFFGEHLNEEEGIDQDLEEDLQQINAKTAEDNRQHAKNNSMSGPSAMSAKEKFQLEKQQKKALVQKMMKDKQFEQMRSNSPNQSRNSTQIVHKKSSSKHQFQYSDSKSPQPMKAQQKFETIKMKASPERKPEIPGSASKPHQVKATRKSSIDQAHPFQMPGNQSPKRVQSSQQVQQATPEKSVAQNSFARASELKTEKEQKLLQQQIQGIQETQNVMLSQLTQIGEMMKMLSTRVTDLETQFQQTSRQQAQIMQVIGNPAGQGANVQSNSIYQAPLALPGMQQMDEQQAKLQLIIRMREELDQSIRSMQAPPATATGFSLASPIGAQNTIPTGSAFSQGLNQLTSNLNVANPTPSPKIDDIQLAHLSQQIQNLSALKTFGAGQIPPQPNMGSSSLGMAPNIQPMGGGLGGLPQTNEQQMFSQNNVIANNARAGNVGGATPIEESLLNLSEIKQQ